MQAPRTNYFLNVSVIIIMLLLGTGVYRFWALADACEKQGLFGCVTGFKTEPAPVSPNPDVPVQTIDVTAITTAVRDLNRLETRSHATHVCATVANENIGMWYAFFNAQMKEICLDGEIIAGVDLAGVAESIKVDPAGQWIRITLPSSQVFAWVPDMNSLDVPTENKGLLPPERDDALMKQALQDTQAAALVEGCTQNVTITAAANAKADVEALVRAIAPQVRDVIVTVDAGDCNVIAD